MVGLEWNIFGLLHQIQDCLNSANAYFLKPEGDNSMKNITGISLLFSVLFISALAYAADQAAVQPGPSSGGSGHSPGFFSSNNPHAIFAGPKIGWLTLPEEGSGNAAEQDLTTR
jgi:hypothetical protein